jgi:hypothetical protein
MPRKHTLHGDAAGARPTSRPTAVSTGPGGSVTVSDGGCPGRTRAVPPLCASVRVGVLPAVPHRMVILLRRAPVRLRSSGAGHLSRVGRARTVHGPAPACGLRLAAWRSEKRAAGRIPSTPGERAPPGQPSFALLIVVAKASGTTRRSSLAMGTLRRHAGSWPDARFTPSGAFRWQAGQQQVANAGPRP